MNDMGQDRENNIRQLGRLLQIFRWIPNAVSIVRDSGKHQADIKSSIYLVRLFFILI